MNEVQLIELVKKNPILYNPHKREYRDSIRRNEIWNRMGEKLGISGLECKDAWGKLRNAHTQALKRRVKTSGTQAKKLGKWKLEDQMSFLVPFQETKTMQENIKEENEITASDDFEEVQNQEQDVMSSYSASEMVMGENSKIRSQYLTQSTELEESENDEISLFFASMAKSVKKLSQVEQIKLKRDVANLVFDAEMRDMQGVYPEEYLVVVPSSLSEKKHD